MSDKIAVIGRRPRSDEYSPSVATTHSTAAAGGGGGGGDAGEMRVNSQYARPQQHHYSDYVQVCSALLLLPLSKICKLNQGHLQGGGKWTQLASNLA